MRVKRYVVDSMPDAMQQIRSDLGKNAVILNTKEIRSGGFMGMFGKKKFEVIAAADQQEPNRRLKPSKAAARKPLVSEDGPTSSPAEHAAEDAAAYEPVRPAIGTATLDRREDPRDSKLLEEIRQMKEMMFRFAGSQQTDGALPELERIRARLSAHEFDALLIEEIVASASVEPKNPTEAAEENGFKTQVRNYLNEMLKPGLIQEISPATRIAHFVGPTGVGKTTTIAKLAADLSVKRRKKVGLITADTYRIAAVEQLRTYATILDVPLEVVHSPLDFNKAYEKLADRDMILMDTAGRNYRNEMYVSELNSFLKAKGQSETFLVLSLTMKYRDMKAITQNFSKFHLDKVLLTKLDETDSLGPVFNLVRDFAIPLSYVTTGQNVPDDITVIDSQKLIDRILEGEDHEGSS